MNNFWETFNKMPIVGIMRNLPADKSEKIAEIYLKFGLTNLEVTMNSAGAAETITLLEKRFGTELNIGAGTVCTLEDLEAALSAGAKFVVTPVLDEEVITKCVKVGVPIFAGAYTPTEIFKAWKLGADMVKVFPATKLGPEFIKDILGPLNKLKLIPTGGVSIENFSQFLQAGAAGVGIGSHLFPMDVIQKGNWRELETLYEKVRLKYHQYLQGERACT